MTIQKLRRSALKHMLKCHARGAALALAGALGLAGSPAAQALTDLSVGVTYPFVQGLDYATYASRVGVRAGMSWVLNDSKTFFATGTAEYQPYAIPRTSGHMSQFSALGGVELRAVGEDLWLKPFFGTQLGVAYNLLTFNAGAATATNNQSFYPNFRVNMGVATPTLGPVSLVFETPVTVLFSKDSFVNFGLHILARIEL